MTLDERIEAAARRWCELDPKSPEPDAPIVWSMKQAKAWEPRAELLRAVLPVLFPELLASPPTHFLAPMEPTVEMGLACQNQQSDRYVAMGRAIEVYAAMRDACINQKDSEG